jgi:Tol biopolymer transport system component
LRANGEVVPLTTLDASRGEHSHRSPAFLPASDRFVYLVLSTVPEHQGTFLGSLSDANLKRRVAASIASPGIGIDADGRINLLVVNDDGALVAQPFDAALERLSGEPTVVATDRIAIAPSVRVAAFSVAGRVAVYRPRFAPLSRLAWVDRQGGVRSEVALPAEHSYRFPALSDDGTKMVALRDDQPDAAGLWWLAGGASPQRLTRGGQLMSAWAPGGSDIVYSSPEPSGWHLLRRPIAGLNDAQLLLGGTEPAVKRIRDVTDELVVFQGSDDNLWLLPLAGERNAHPLMQTPTVENHARVSPNGRWIAFSSTDADETRVYVTTFPEPTDLTPVSPGAGSDPQWRADGRELYYIGPGDWLIAVEVETQGAFAAGTQTPLFDARFDPQTRAFGSPYAVTPDGERFLVAENPQYAEPHLIVTQNWSGASAPAASR